MVYAVAIPYTPLQEYQESGINAKCLLLICEGDSKGQIMFDQQPAFSECLMPWAKWRKVDITTWSGPCQTMGCQKHGVDVNSEAESSPKLHTLWTVLMEWRNELESLEALMSLTLDLRELAKGVAPYQPIETR